MDSRMKTASPTSFPTAIPIAVTLFLAILLTLAPSAAPVVHAQTPREAGKGATQSPACRAKVDEWLKECAEEEEEDARAGRSGLGWTGIGLASAGAGVLVQGLTVSRWRSCGPNYRNHCENLERVYRRAGGTMLATGLAFIVIDETRRTREKERLRLASRQVAVAVGPRAVHLRMQW